MFTITSELYPVGDDLYEVEVCPVRTDAGTAFYARVYHLDDSTALGRSQSPLRVSLYDGWAGGNYGKPGHLKPDLLLAQIHGQRIAREDAAKRAERRAA